ncbi:reverse transcriptase [Cucumis melo var. makuwa]|uniref:Reverse transcriptase n=1 Tax=Cucumis melo var. makuwa TaxID=1194695 RepID=A0A5D3CPS9_CUCMM|nr:reverse transcriptase [Cucumis melo var. makuwa]TYK13555.1 reverse transcriptase [Cucumis melo var. makuwa]
MIVMIRHVYDDVVTCYMPWIWCMLALAIRVVLAWDRSQPDCLSVSFGYTKDQFVLGVPLGSPKTTYVPMRSQIARVRERASSGVPLFRTLIGKGRGKLASDREGSVTCHMGTQFASAYILLNIHQKPQRGLKLRPYFQEDQEIRMKVDLPTFNGRIDVENFLDWIKNIENLFDYSNTSEHKKVRLVALKLQGGASAWCGQQGHLSNGCPQRRTLTIEEGQEENDSDDNIYEISNLDEGDQLSCVI